MQKRSTKKLMQASMKNNQINSIVEVSRDGRINNTQTRVVGIINNRQGASLHAFHRNPVA